MMQIDGSNMHGRWQGGCFAVGDILNRITCPEIGAEIIC